MLLRSTVGDCFVLPPICSWPIYILTLETETKMPRKDSAMAHNKKHSSSILGNAPPPDATINFIPEWLCYPPVRPLISIRSFALSVVQSSPLPQIATISHTPPLEKSTHVDLSILSKKHNEQHIFPSIAVRVAAQQPTAIGPSARHIPSYHTPPTFAEILSSIAKSEPEHAKEENIGKGVCLEVSVYDSEAPTKSIHTRFPVNANLTELVDSIHCTSDILGNDGMNMPKTGAALYIEGVMYEDRRFGATDYTSSIVFFLRKHGMDVQVKTVATTFLELSIKFGVPYVYVHKGDCEHLILFTTVYKVYSEDCEMKVLWRRAPRVIACDVCHMHYAVKFTFGDRVGDRSPFHFCARCYEVAHYAQSGELFKESENFSVYSHPSPL